MDMNWLEVSVEADGEAAEAVSEVFNRYGQGGAVVEIAYSTEDTCLSDTPLLARVRTYLPADGERSRHKIEEALWHLSRLYPFPEPTFRALAEDDWATAWKKSYRPLRIGERLVVVPSWCDFTAAARDVVITLDPGMAFGTGLHPTTRMSLVSVEQYARPGQSVLDMGTGSGILSIAAARLDVASVLAVEKDPLAARVARENVALNNVQDTVRVVSGSLDQVSGQFDLILVNILAGVIVSLIGEGLLSHLKPGGFFVGAGIIEEWETAVQQALEEREIEIVGRFQERDWVTLIAQMPLHSRSTMA